MKFPKVKIIERKLGQERAWGTSDEKGLIELDPRLTESERLAILLHEATHVCFPDMSEKDVCRLGKMLGPILWAQGYRRVLQ